MSRLITGSYEALRRYALTLLSLDRCRHGRHQDERCLSCPSGLSEGNPHLSAGQKIGYDEHGDPLYVPAAEDMRVPDAWYTAPADVTARDDSEINRVYRERNRCVAGYTRRWPSILTAAHDYPGFWIVFIVSPAGQLSWHIPDRDVDLFAHVQRRTSWEWDGHSNEEKYQRLELACSMWEGKA